ncbi:YqcI/YcgG family protein [Streptomyces sp. NPDC059443]|uniref:YqcI/YcgG family protein n=1 Tax=unclassified Streptomyces TaxID=2593676 RepID=UPI0036CEA7D2
MVNTSTTSRALISQECIAEGGTDWHRDALREVASRLEDPGFPCVFSRNALRKRLLRFVFVENGDDSGIRHLAQGLKEYVELSREWDGRLDTAYPLVIAFSAGAVEAVEVVEAVEGRRTEDYHAFGWKVLQRLHEIDPAPWPSDVDPDPSSPGWSMCFDGMPLFCNMSSPAHHKRRSRNLGKHFVMVVNPRERFDVFAGDTPSGRKVRANIRGRIEQYDEIPHAPQLGSYGAGALEWFQYGLTDENAERTDTCPFEFRQHRAG